MKPVILSSAIWGSVFIRENMTGIDSKNVNGLAAHAGKLCGQRVALLELEDESCPGIDNSILLNFDPGCLISVGEAFGCQKNLVAGDMIISSSASYIDDLQQKHLNDTPADRRLVDLSLRAAERFANDENNCKVVVGKVLLNPGTRETGRRLNFLPRNGVYCMDCNGYPLAQWAAGINIPFVLIRTVVPPSIKGSQLEITRFKWDMAKRNFWIIKGILEGLKKTQVKEKLRKVDLI